MRSRRQFCGAMLATTLMTKAFPSLAAGAPGSGNEALAELERSSGGRLGVHVTDGETAFASIRGDQRFGMCSTFKLVLAAMVLHRADQGRISLARELAIREQDRVMHMPDTEPMLGRTMSVVALAESTQKTSDNLAANLLLRSLGGPEAFTEFCREFGDSKTRLDRYEPGMNLVPAGEVRDTTTPIAMAMLVSRLLSSDGLAAASRDRLKQWMIDTSTGLRRLRAGLPANAVAGDKTGTALHEDMPDKINDIAVWWRERGKPVVITAFFESKARSESIRSEDEAVLKAVGAVAAHWSQPR